MEKVYVENKGQMILSYSRLKTRIQRMKMKVQNPTIQMGRLNILLNLYCLLELESQFAYSGVFLPLPNNSSFLVCKAIFCSCSDPTKE